MVWRVGVIAVCLAGWFFTQRLIASRRPRDGVIYDHMHVMTARWNASLHRNPRAANALLIASSLGIDLLALFVLVHAVIGPTFTPFWGMLALFALRQISQAAIALPAPDGAIWRHPGVPSLFVTYQVGNDFFFSGHTALAVYGAFAVATLQIPLVTAIAVAVAALEAIVVIVLRAHWTMDVLAGAFVAVAAAALFLQV